MSDGSTEGQGRKPRARVYRAPDGAPDPVPPGPGTAPPPSAAPPGGTPRFRPADAAPPARALENGGRPPNAPVEEVPPTRSRAAPARAAPAPASPPPEPPAPAPAASAAASDAGRAAGALALPTAPISAGRGTTRETTVRHDPPAGDRVRLSGRTAVQPDPRQRFPRQEDLSDDRGPDPGRDGAATAAGAAPAMARGVATGAGPRAQGAAPRSPMGGTVSAVPRSRGGAPVVLAITSLLAVAGVGLWMALRDDGRVVERERALPPRALEAAGTQARVREAERLREEELLRDRQARALEETRAVRPAIPPAAGVPPPFPDRAGPAQAGGSQGGGSQAGLAAPPALGFEVERRAQGTGQAGRTGDFAALPLPPPRLDPPRGGTDGPGFAAPPSDLPAPFEGQPRIVLHHRQGGRLAAETVAGLAAGYGPLPEIRQVAATPDAPVVRYFHPGDRAAAESLLRRLGGNWSLQDFTTFTPRPRVGTLEVWLPGS